MRVAIVIPCRNEQRYIGRCLQSIVDCNYPKDLLRVWVSDGRSDDSTRDIVNEYAKQHAWIGLLDNELRTTPVALNLGIKNSPDADAVIILGAHAEVLPDFVSRNVELLQEDPAAGCVGGLIENVNEDEVSEAIGAAMSSAFGVGNAHFRTGGSEGYVDTVAFGAYRKEVFEKIGLFDEELTRNQDDEFNYRVIKAGFRIRLWSAIRSRYYVRASFRKLLRQYYQYGYWKVYVNKKHGAITTLRQLVPLGFVLFLFSGSIWPLLSWKLALAWTGILLLYVAGAFFFALRKSASPKKVLRIVWAFVCLHAGYGFGYLRGLIDFFLLGRKPGRGSALTR